MKPAELEIKNISKTFKTNGLQVCKDICFSLNKGEIFCIAGENGAGKTTLMKILYGMEKIDSGEIFIKGKKEYINSPLKANDLSIGMVHQHFMLFPNLTVAENVTFGIEPVKAKIICDKKKAVINVQKIIDKYNLSLDANSFVSSLTIGQKQQTEILKLLYRNSDILILDEPTSVLTETEIESLFFTLKKLKSLGKTIILITHKLKEIKRMSDRVAVMKQGRLIGIFNTSEVTKDELSSLMFGHEISNGEKNKTIVDKSKIPTISFKNVTVKKHGLPHPFLDNLSFDVFPGEILGFVGISGNGMGHLEGALSGVISISDGQIFHKNKDITNVGTAILRKEGMGFVPSDRLGFGTSERLSLGQNLIIHRRRELSPGGIFSKKKIEPFLDKLISNYDIKGKSTDTVSDLSGGNIQKLVIAREMNCLKDYIIFSEPTWGLDMESTQFVYSQIKRIKEKGVSIIIISSNTQEVLELADRIIILRKGKIAREFENNINISIKEIGDYMLGIKKQKEVCNE